MLIGWGENTVMRREINAHLTGNRAYDHQDNIPTIGKLMLETATRRMNIESSLTKTYDFEQF
jgi:hypothetical protein